MKKTNSWVRGSAKVLSTQDVSVLDYARYAELFGFHGFRDNYPSDIVPAPKSALLGLPDSKAADFEDFDLRPDGWLQDYGGPVPACKA